MNRDEIYELAAGYALGTLDLEDRERFETLPTSRRPQFEVKGEALRRGLGGSAARRGLNQVRVRCASEEPRACRRGTSRRWARVLRSPARA